MFRLNLHFEFEKWRITHNSVGGLLLVLAFSHSFTMITRNLRLVPMQFLWFIFLAIALSFYSYHKFIVPASLRKKRYRVDSVNRETLIRQVKDFDGRTFYICCPTPMMKAITSILDEMGVSGNRIRSEVFSL